MVNHAEAWKINKDSKIPYNEQLIRNIRWSIFTGEVRWTEKLPPIRILADDLGISVNTVRNAYKQLEQQEMVVTRPHHGTIVLAESMDKIQMEEELITSIKNALYYRLSIDEVRSIVEKVLQEVGESKKKSVIFVYEERYIGHRFAMQIAEDADVEVEEVQIDQLQSYLEEHRNQIEHLDAIITTYFLYAKVRSIARSYQPIIYGLTVEVSPYVINAVESLESGSTVAVVCRKDESAGAFANLIQKMRSDLDVEVYHEDKWSEWMKIAEKASVICASPTLIEGINRSECPVPVYEVWHKINEQSMNMLKDYLH